MTKVAPGPERVNNANIISILSFVFSDCIAVYLSLLLNIINHAINAQKLLQRFQSTHPNTIQLNSSTNTSKTLRHCVLKCQLEEKCQGVIYVDSSESCTMAYCINPNILIPTTSDRQTSHLLLQVGFKVNYRLARGKYQ